MKKDDELKQQLREQLDGMGSPSDDQLNELKLTWAGKLFFASVAAYISSNAISSKLPLKIRGNKEQMQALADAIMSSKEFQKEITKPGAKVEDVLRKMNIKNMSRERFKQLTGKDWPL